MPQIIIYRYDASPFSVKVDDILALKHIPHHRVNVSATLPRPEITKLLGVNYRRIPILAIGNDVYCDTSLIASTLERRFPTAQGYGTIFPVRKGSNSRDTGLIKAFSKYYADVALFPLAARQLPWDRFPPSFLEDRSKFQGAPINVQKLVAAQPEGLSLLSSHIAQVEEQLQDGREWLFDTVTPSLADISVHFLSWVQSFKAAKGLITKQSFPNTLRWLQRVNSYLDDQKARNSVSTITGEQAAKSICTSDFESPDVVGVDQTELDRLGLQVDQVVMVFPEDTAQKYPTVGILVGLNKEEVVLQVEGSVGRIRCHFPRLGFKIISKARESRL